MPVEAAIKAEGGERDITYLEEKIVAHREGGTQP